MREGSRWRFRLAVLGLAALTTGCVAQREQELKVDNGAALAYLEDKPPELQRHFYIAMAQGQRNRVLNDMRLGLASFALGRTDLAEQLFDDALGGIEAVYANNETALAARQLFVKELTKDFKGEPYERVMAYYYRGLLYMGRGEYDTARASFKGGMLQDAFAEEEQNRADFALMPYLQGWASRCMGNPSLAEEDFKEFHEAKGTASLPGLKDNVLVLVETGSAPVKFATAESAGGKPRFLKMRRASATETAWISWAAPAPSQPPAQSKAKPDKKDKDRDQALQQPTGKHGADAMLIEDIFHQAATRGGREFDALLDGKAQFKSVTNTVGNAAIVGAVVAGSVAARSNNKETQRDAAIATGALALVALAAKVTANAVEAEADTRYWDNLPDRVYGLPLSLPDSVHSVMVEFKSASGEPLRTREVTIKRAGRCGLAWVRGETAIPFSARAPYSAPTDQMSQPVHLPTTQSLKPATPDPANGDKKE